MRRVLHVDGFPTLQVIIFCVIAVNRISVAADGEAGHDEHECRPIRTDSRVDICYCVPADPGWVKFIIWKIDFQICSCNNITPTYQMKIVLPSTDGKFLPVFNGMVNSLHDSEPYGQFTSSNIASNDYAKYYKDKQAHIFIYPNSAVMGNSSLPSASLYVSCTITAPCLTT